MHFEEPSVEELDREVARRKLRKSAHDIECFFLFPGYLKV